jgi:hypothetical protein
MNERDYTIQFGGLAAIISFWSLLIIAWLYMILEQLKLLVEATP